MSGSGIAVLGLVGFFLLVGNVLLDEYRAEFALQEV
jgi:hypothetical protein